MKTAVVGINWGDEGKGRMVDLLSEKFDVVVRYQGGNNAGHTVVNERGKFVLNLLPSGILRPEVVCVMGNGMVVDLEHLDGEIARLKAAGITITPENLKISDKAVICMPYNKLQDVVEEDRLKDKKFGSTRRGIGPIYADKYMKKAMRMGDLKDLGRAKQRLYDIVEWKNLTLKAYNSEVNPDDMFKWLEKYSYLYNFVCDTGEYLLNASKNGKNIIFEAQLGALRDIDLGIYPYTSSSNAIAAYAPIGAGVPSLKVDVSLGIMKAYSTCVGEGPFVCEALDDIALQEHLRNVGGEYGAATGRPRRVGAFDVVASRYGILAQGADEIALTKLDVLTGLEKIPVCVAYELNGKRITTFPYSTELNDCKPIYEYFDGWTEDISGVKSFDELPEAARKYVNYIEKATECKIKYISVGAEREQYIVK